MRFRSPPPTPSPDRLIKAFQSGEQLPDIHEFERLHYDDLVYRPRLPTWAPEDLWSYIKFSRMAAYRRLPLVAASGEYIKYRIPIGVERLLLECTQLSSQWIEPGTKSAGDGARYFASSLIEEAIASSQIEGVATTRKVAKEMIRSGRTPRNRDERAVLANFKAIQFITRVRTQPLTLEIVLELHRTLTDGWAEEASRGVVRTTDDIVVADVDTGETLHQPPPAPELPKRLAALIAFANAADDEKNFVHPLVRASALHFMLAYEHPFADGNGRTARALFHWAMLHHKYPLYEFLPVSRAILRARAQYARAFLCVETDEFDLTYFLDFQLSAVRRTLAEAHGYLEKEREEHRGFLRQLSRAAQFNFRQRTLLRRAVERPDTIFSVHSHAISHQITGPTARRDLEELEQAGLLIADRESRTHSWIPAADIKKRLASRK